MSRAPTNTHLSALAGDYFDHRHARGYQLLEAQRHVFRFLEYLWQSGNHTKVFTLSEVLTWIHADGNRKRSYQAQMLNSMRGYTQYCLSRGTNLPVPGSHLLPGSRSRRTPHIYTQHEIDALLYACPIVFDPPTAATMATIISFLVATGLRIGEALSVESGDLDHEANTLLVRANKNGPRRIIPLHPTTIAALISYETSPPRTGLGLQPGGPLFLNRRRRPHQAPTIESYFAKLRNAADFEWHGSTPCLHDLRHTFATRVMIRAYTAEDGVPANTMGLLANWLGHSSPAHTYWYVQAVPELLGLAAQRRTNQTSTESPS
ncbi:tyrosine-type recombinase/integrase [Brevibacterium aurantiacum]|uniref:tyrosine-type recombinase/integrase n=1 Tax=Brevibacterium aurantiacum TaxID=273384 RepID=UPI0026514305|nr:tyrosine-type recombinase/integrase [Brevibacterium aurantiacum]MDN5910880.1 tyrosine-type recombinase/integrase [Brevibacterium sp.]